MRQCLDIRWGAIFRELHAVPVPVTYGIPASWYADDETIAGAILTGGNDLASCGGDDLSTQRDAAEGELVALMLDKGLPVLGICRGCQFLAEYAGGVVGKVSGHAGTRHLVASPAGHPGAPSARDVNSFHNYGVLRLPSGCDPLAVAPDDSVEAFRSHDGAMLGVMWHPEREPSLSAADADLIRAHFKLGTPAP